MSRRVRLPVPIDEMPCVLRTERATPPFRWEEVFGRNAPVELEIGTGKGLFLARAAALWPDRSFLGVERAGKYFRRAVVRVHRAGLSNVRLVRTDAFDLLDRWIPPGSVSVAHVYFPDPWPKTRHAKRRLLQGELFRGVHRVLAPGGVFCMASDVEEYFREALDEIRVPGLFEQIPWPIDAPDRIPTSYAIKYEQAGRSLHYAKFARLEPPAAAGTRD